MSKYTVELKKSEQKTFTALDAITQKAISAKLLSLADNPYQQGCRKIQGLKDTWRVRAGDFRIVYSVHEEALLVLVIRIGNRKDVYRGM